MPRGGRAAQLGEREAARGLSAEAVADSKEIYDSVKVLVLVALSGCYTVLFLS